MNEFEKLGIDHFFKHEMSSQTFRKINQSNNIKIVTINDGWICNAIPEYYIHEIRNYFNYTLGTLEITL